MKSPSRGRKRSELEKLILATAWCNPQRMSESGFLGMDPSWFSNSRIFDALLILRRLNLPALVENYFWFRELGSDDQIMLISGFRDLGISFAELECLMDSPECLPALYKNYVLELEGIIELERLNTAGDVAINS